MKFTYGPGYNKPVRPAPIKKSPFEHFRATAGHPPRGDESFVVDNQPDSGDDSFCSVYGCTNRWTTQGPNGKKCSKHYWNESEPFPEVRSMADWTGPKYPGDKKGWARRLKDAHEAGWKLTDYQVSCYKTALRIE